jgi:hypothetical protein
LDNLVNHIKTLDNFAKAGMVSIQVLSVLTSVTDKKL